MSAVVLILPELRRVKPGRIPCVNPSCKRTAPREDDDETEIICGKCFRALPAGLRRRYQQLSRREKRLLKLAQRPYDKGEIGHHRVMNIAGLIERSRLRNWQDIRGCFRGDKPSGLEGFLQEVGL